MHIRYIQATTIIIIIINLNTNMNMMVLKKQIIMGKGTALKVRSCKK